MSSEAAQKAYPDGMHLDPSTIARARRAFDRGAVEALRHAAKKIRHKQHPESVRQMLNRMADQWEAGQ